MQCFSFARYAVGAVALIWSVGAQAAVTQQEAQQLGTTLTPWGAEKAGNADGSIPAYTGAAPPIPASYVPGSGRYPDPYATEKPLFSINAANLDKYAGKVDPGTQALMKRHPDYRIDIYPTHRDVRYSDADIRNCKNNALNAQLLPSGEGFTGAKGCVPFPIPKSAMELMWNHGAFGFGARWPWFGGRWGNTMVDSSGTPINMGETEFYQNNLFLDPNLKQLPDEYHIKQSTQIVSPPGQAGTRVLIWYTTNFENQEGMTWLYQVGQRRVRIAPEFKYDTPNSQFGGLPYWDELQGFYGRPDRFDWKLVGKKEAYIPYHNYKMVFDSPQKVAFGKNFINPDVMRWELHRVWVVEATLKQGARHAVARKIFYLDEDTNVIVGYTGYDQAGNVFRVFQGHIDPLYDKPAFMSFYSLYDLAKNSYMQIGVMDSPESKIQFFDAPPAKGQPLTPDGLMTSSYR